MSRIKNILVPVDFSDASKRALRYACELADTFEATLARPACGENPYRAGRIHGVLCTPPDSSSIRWSRRRASSSRRC